ncbi:MAG TPA: hypothetical protein VF621_08570 [Pyrinomonadaceae bacterium]|jgi:hypothetical protein
MLNPFQPNLRKPWLLLCTTLLLAYSIMPGDHRTLFFADAPSSVLEAAMALLSFPLGTAVAFLFHADDFGVFGRFAFWAAAMGLGYAQWFHLFPALKRWEARRRTDALNPTAVGSVAPTSPLGLGVTPPRPALEAARPPVPQFNDRGMTPLERILWDGED